MQCQRANGVLTSVGPVAPALGSRWTALYTAPAGRYPVQCSIMHFPMSVMAHINISAISPKVENI